MHVDRLDSRPPTGPAAVVTKHAERLPFACGAGGLSDLSASSSLGTLAFLLAHPTGRRQALDGELVGAEHRRGEERRRRREIAVGDRHCVLYNENTKRLACESKDRCCEEDKR